MRRPKLAVLPGLAVLLLSLAACGNQASPVALTTVGPVGGAGSTSSPSDEPDGPGTQEPTEEPTTPPPADPVETSIVDLVVGTCVLEGPDETGSGTVTAVNCASPHIQEVYYVGEHSTAAYDEATMRQEARSSCSAAFDTVTGGAGTEYGSLNLIPGEEAWNSGIHSYYCFIYSSDKSEITGSVVEGNAEPGGSGGGSGGDTDAETT